MESDGPMWRSDWPEGEDASLAVSVEDRVDDWDRRVVSFELSNGVERLANAGAHSSDVESFSKFRFKSVILYYLLFLKIIDCFFQASFLTNHFVPVF